MFLPVKEFSLSTISTLVNKLITLIHTRQRNLSVNEILGKIRTASAEGGLDIIEDVTGLTNRNFKSLSGITEVQWKDFLDTGNTDVFNGKLSDDDLGKLIESRKLAQERKILSNTGVKNEDIPTTGQDTSQLASSTLLDDLINKNTSSLTISDDDLNSIIANDSTDLGELLKSPQSAKAYLETLARKNLSKLKIRSGDIDSILQSDSIDLGKLTTSEASANDLFERISDKKS